MTSVRRDGLCPAALLAVAAVGILAASASIDEAYAHEGPSRTVTMNPEGLTIRPSSYGPKETMDRLAASVVDKGMAILARIDHAAAAAKAGLELRPTEVLIFGNPRAGTPLMQAAQTIGIDLPLKVLVWQDEKGETWLAYNDPNWLAKRHGADLGTDTVPASMAEGLSALADEATTRTTREAP
jgi:uncharacterized protein (DUF302 family)